MRPEGRAKNFTFRLRGAKIFRFFSLFFLMFLKFIFFLVFKSFWTLNFLVKGDAKILDASQRGAKNFRPSSSLGSLGVEKSGV